MLALSQEETSSPWLDAMIDVVVSGHSHHPKIETVSGVLYLNPGSAGPRRCTLPIALATLELAGDAVRPRLHRLGGPALPRTDAGKAASYVKEMN